MSIRRIVRKDHELTASSVVRPIMVRFHNLAWAPAPTPTGLPFEPKG